MLRKIIVACFFICLIKADEMEDMMKQLHATCVAETGATEDAIEGTKSGNFPEDNNLKCFFKCLLITTGMMEESGAVDVEVAIAMMPPDLAAVADPVIRKCSQMKGKDTCDISYEIYKCLYKEDKRVMIVP